MPPNESVGVTPAGKGSEYVAVPLVPSAIIEDAELNSTIMGASCIVTVCVLTVPNIALPLAPVRVITIVSLGSYTPSAAAAISIPFSEIKYV